MKKIALSVAALALTAGSALAADLPSRKGPPMLPPPPPPPMWTGFYVGLNAGGTWANSNTITLSGAPVVMDNNPFLVAVGPATAAAIGGNGIFSTNSNGGFIGGGQVGYNWQFYNSFVAGIEADIQGLTSGRSSTTGLTAVPVTAGGFIGGFNAVQTSTVSRSVDYIGTVRGRLGWLFTPTLLVYGTGGLAYGGVNFNWGLAGAPIASPIPFTGWSSGQSFSDTRVGWTAGGGLEWMFWPNWSAKVEYLYYDLGTVRSNGFAVSNSPAGPAFGVATQASTRFNGNIVRAGLNYHFNWGAPAPVVAKY
jgi:outer membrane immunogenic protein